MAACKAGTPGTLVAPAAIIEAHEADNSDPVEVNKAKVSQRELKTGKYAKQEIKTFKPGEAKKDKDTELSWIELKMTNAKGKPAAGEPYEVKLPDDSIATGTLDDKGEARIDNIPKGNCEVTFPRLHLKTWQKSG